MAGGDLLIQVAGTDHRVRPDVRFTFGRAESCTVCLDPDDPAISRLAGAVEHAGGVWWLVNTSTSRQLAVVDELGLRSVLTPGRRIPVEGRLRVIVDGAPRDNGVTRSHELVLHGPAPATDPAAPAATGVPTVFGQQVRINDEDRRALVALFAGYLLEGADYDPNPRSYAAAAARLGWPRTTLVKRIEYLRTRLTNAGVPNMQGWNALAALAEYVLTTGLITRDDLRLIGR